MHSADLHSADKRNVTSQREFFLLLLFNWQRHSLEVVASGWWSRLPPPPTATSPPYYHHIPCHTPPTPQCINITPLPCYLALHKLMCSALEGLALQHHPCKILDDSPNTFQSLNWQQMVLVQGGEIAGQSYRGVISFSALAIFENILQKFKWQ